MIKKVLTLNFGLATTICFTACVIACVFVSSCNLEKRVSVTTGRYENIPNRYTQPHSEIETSRDTVATYRF